MSQALSRENVQHMLQMQKLIKREFGVHIKLDDAKAIHRFHEYAQKSENDVLKQEADHLAGLLPPEETADEAVETAAADDKVKRRIYRGQVIEEVETASTEAEVSEDGSQKTIIYRGQRVAV